jgi:uncharacterized protein (TIGR03435 family)
MAVAAPLAFAQAGAAPDARTAAAVSKAYVPTLTFDVASIRQSPVADSYLIGAFFSPHTGSFRATNVDYVFLLSSAYDIRADQISDMPDSRAMFNIQAKSGSVADEHLAGLSKDQQQLEQQHMLQTMLADRFKLKAHWETREAPAYDLLVSKKGPKMQEAKGEPPSPEESKSFGNYPVPPLYQRGDSQVGFDFVAHGCSMIDITGSLAVPSSIRLAFPVNMTSSCDITARC